MAGSFIPYALIDDRAVMRKFGQLLKKSDSLAPVLKNIGEYKVEATQGLFDKQQDPQGIKWAALSSRYKKKKKGPKILTESSHLRNSIIYAVKSGNLHIGTNDVKAAAHQFGIDKSITVPAHRRLVKKVYGHALKFPVWASVRAHSFNPHLPARRYLGWNAADKVEIRGIVADFMEL